MPDLDVEGEHLIEALDHGDGTEDESDGDPDAQPDRESEPALV